MFEKITLRQAVKRIVFVRNCQHTVSGYSPVEVATGRRPPDLLDVETANPEQLSLEGLPEDRTATQLRTIAMKAHLEARQSTDLKKDLAKRVMRSDVPYTKGEKVFVWHQDDNKKKSEGVWMRGTVVSQEGAMVLVQLPTLLLRVNQSKVRRDHDEWHDVQIPHLEGPSSDNKSGSSTDEVDNASAAFVSEHEVCYRLCCDSGPVDCIRSPTHMQWRRSLLESSGKNSCSCSGLACSLLPRSVCSTL